MSTHAAGASQSRWLSIARYAAMGSAVAILISIPASQILLGVALLCLLLGRARFQWQPIYLPLGLFLGWMLVSLAFSPDPAAGLPQVKKLYVFLALPAILAALHGASDFVRLFWGWLIVASASCLLAMGQFVWKIGHAYQQGIDIYAAYVGERITGFMSHWMTFSGEAMIVILLLLSMLLFGPRRDRRRTLLCWAAFALLGLGIVFGFTRGIWIATAAAIMPLLWAFRRWLAIAMPLCFVVVLAVGPAGVQQRFLSIFRPSGELDSNQHRVVTFFTGIEMIKAHPLLGLGPEMVGHQVEHYAPAWIRRPFPEGYYGHLHNIYVHYGAERGLPAVALLLWIFGVVFYHQARALRRLRQPRDNPSAATLEDQANRRFIHWGVIAVSVGIMVGGLFEYNLGDSEILTLFLTVVAGGYLATATEEPKAIVAKVGDHAGS